MDVHEGRVEREPSLGVSLSQRFGPRLDEDLDRLQGFRLGRLGLVGVPFDHAVGARDVDGKLRVGVARPLPDRLGPRLQQAPRDVGRPPGGVNRKEPNVAVVLVPPPDQVGSLLDFPLENLEGHLAQQHLKQRTSQVRIDILILNSSSSSSSSSNFNITSVGSGRSSSPSVFAIIDIVVHGGVCYPE
jgi:hypothetical protein